ncbi:hypothetical protein ACWEKT_25620 [Nocardia takedensis]
MARSVTSALAGRSAGTVSPSTAPPTAAGNGGQSRKPDKSTEPLVLVPAGFIADIVGGLSGTIGELTGGYFGNAELGKQIGDAASPLIKLFPFQIVAPQVAPAGAGPDDSGGGSQDAMVIVPAAFLGGILGGIGGKLLGGSVDKWLGGSGSTGSSVGSAVGGFLGGLLPFQVVPPTLMPQAAGPDGQAPQEPLVVVPAGFFGNLLGAVAGTFGKVVAGDTGRKVGEAAAPLFDLIPFHDVPDELIAHPGDAGGSSSDEKLVVLPAGFFSSIVGGLAETIGGEIGSWFGDSETGAAVGGGVGTIIEMLPFHAVPDALLPAAVGPAAEQSPAEKLMFVPAQLFSNLLSGLSGSVGCWSTDIWDSSKWGWDAKQPPQFGEMQPFQVVAPPRA